MKLSRRRIVFFVSVSALLLSVGLVIWRAFRQEQLNRGLITAIKHKDTPSALACLAAGADANALDLPFDTRRQWRRLWDRLRGTCLEPRFSR